MLNLLLFKAKEADTVTGFKVHFLNILIFNCSMTHCILCRQQFDNLKAILGWFELFSGLKINHNKCELIVVKLELKEVNLDLFVCHSGDLCSTYLGLLSCIGKPIRSKRKPLKSKDLGM